VHSPFGSNCARWQGFGPLSTFAMHEAKQSSALARVSEPVMSGELATVSQSSSNPSYETWPVRPCAQASAIDRGLVQLDAVADAEVKEPVALGAIVDEEAGQGPSPVGGGSAPVVLGSRLK
jgi:hypothetical protein